VGGVGDQTLLPLARRLQLATGVPQTGAQLGQLVAGGIGRELGIEVPLAHVRQVAGHGGDAVA
jgi:hypothetical protein